MTDFPEVEIECEFCGTPHKELVIDGHISKPHLCSNCWRQTVKVWDYMMDQMKDQASCFTCANCTYIHEYETYFCETHKMPIFGSPVTDLCGSYKIKTEE